MRQETGLFKELPQPFEFLIDLPVETSPAKKCVTVTEG